MSKQPHCSHTGVSGCRRGKVHQLCSRLLSEGTACTALHEIGAIPATVSLSLTP
jgi:hypothetical protein